MSHVIFINEPSQANKSVSNLLNVKGWNFSHVECKDATEVESCLFRNKNALIFYNKKNIKSDFITQKLLDRFSTNVHLGIGYNPSHISIFSPDFIKLSPWQRMTLPFLKYLSNDQRPLYPMRLPLSDFINIFHQHAHPSDVLNTLWSMRPTQNPLKFNRILDDKARKEYQAVIGWIHDLSPEMIQRKIPRANVQQAFVLYTVQHFYRPGVKILCVGSHEDTAFDALKRLGVGMEDIDPVKDYDLNAFYHLPTTQKSYYDIIFSTSVIEHVEDDLLFLAQIQDLLAPQGIGILTCDFKDDYKKGDYIFPGNYRFYTQEHLREIMKSVLSGCELLDEPHWDCPRPDFFFSGQQYTFATLTFKRKA